jgi:hypothetical protein
LELTISAGLTTVQGTVFDAGRRPFPRATVVLVPQQSRRENPLFYKRVTSSPAGEFTFPAVEPGDYKVFAWQTAPPGRAEQSAQFLSKYESMGRSATVRQGVSPVPIQLHLIRDAR